MHNHLETLQFKIKCADYHYKQVNDIIPIVSKDNIHILISEFSAMMDVIFSTLHLARSCAQKQSPVDERAYMKSHDARMLDEVAYIQQFMKAHRTDS